MERLAPWMNEYLARQRELYAALPVEQVATLVGLLRNALDADKQVFVFGNGGSAANASHFAVDLGKGASDAMGKPFRVISLNDNTPWISAIGNDYSYEDIFLRQLQNYGRAGDLAMCMSVSGNSPNLVRAMRWARSNGLVTAAMVGAKQGALAEIAEHVLVVPDTHYGRAEDAQMTICHLLCYAFMEPAAGVRA